MTTCEQWKCEVRWCERKLVQLTRQLACLENALEMSMLNTYGPLKILGVRAQIAAYEAALREREELLRGKPEATRHDV